MLRKIIFVFEYFRVDSTRYLLFISFSHMFQMLPFWVHFVKVSLVWCLHPATWWKTVKSSHSFNCRFLKIFPSYHLQIKETLPKPVFRRFFHPPLSFFPSGTTRQTLDDVILSHWSISLCPFFNSYFLYVFSFGYFLLFCL